MLADLRRVIYTNGDVIFSKGENGDCAYLIESGGVEVQVDEQLRVQVGPGDLFGEIALIDQRPRTATVRAIANTILVPIPRNMITELLDRTDPVIRHLLLMVLERYRSNQLPEAAQTAQTPKREQLRGEATQKLRLAHEMSLALENEQFELFYQPICSLKTHEIVGYEALIRWHHPRDGLVGPDDFLWLAEQNGLIREIGLWTLAQTFRDWPQLKQGIQHKRPFVSVNLSPAQLGAENFVEDVHALLNQFVMPNHELKLELTENVIIQNPQNAMTLLQRLTALGSSIALDDFGTGYSGMSALQRYPIGTVKIDRSFINQMLTSNQSAKIVRSAIDLAHALNMDVVAEGVETEEERDVLALCGCDYAQGWLFGRPMAMHRAAALLV